MNEEEENIIHAEIPLSYKEVRCCLRCSLLKTADQFIDNGCENCSFLQMEGNAYRVRQYTTPHYEGIISLINPNDSWVAKWQKIGTNIPGMYAIQVLGELPEDIIDLCEQKGLHYRSQKSKR